MGSGKLIHKGMTEQDVFKALSESGRWEYIASAENWYWFRNIRWGDVIEIRFADGIYTEINFV